MTLAPVSGGILADIITWVRRIIKSPSPQAISDATIADYINRFWAYELPERIQLFELKRQYTFETVANIFEYQAPFAPTTTWNFPANSNPPPFINNPSPAINQTPIPLYHQFRPPIYCDGVQMGWFQSNEQFYNVFPELVLNENPLEGDGTTGPYSTTVSRNPILRGFIDDLGYLQPYVYITFVDASGLQHYIVDSSYTNGSGQGILIETDSTFQNIIGAPLIGSPPVAGGAGTVDYNTGIVTFSWSAVAVPAGTPIEIQTSPFSSGRPRIALFFNNIFKLYPVPDRAYKIQVDAYITPSVFFSSTASIPFAYMSEYIARGAARKILSDNGDYEQMQFYEPLFREQENLVLRRTSRQNAVLRTPTIYSGQTQSNGYLYTQY
jgi:hypothetical protein